jgi:hypothetical protein
VDDEREGTPDPRAVRYGELPELTRALRALGSVRRGGGSQSAFFHPLLEARRRAADARNAHARVRAFDATDLARALERSVERIIAEWPDARVSVRRALRAELVERVLPYSRALRVMSQRATEVFDADEAGQLEAWRAWTVQLAAVFEAADRTWLSIRTVVDALPKSRPV